MPVPTRFEVRGLDRLQRKLGQLDKTGIDSALKNATQEAVLHVHSQVPPYPPPPAGSRYRRTGLLGRSITTEVKHVGASYVGVIGTAVRYAPWVISNERAGSAGPQARVHRGRWYTLQEVVHKEVGAVKKIFEKHVKRLLR